MEKQMHKRAFSVWYKEGAHPIFLALLFFVGFISAPRVLLSRENPEQKVISSSVSQKFYELAYELSNSKDVTAKQIEQAIVFLSASMELDINVRDTQALLLKLCCHNSQQDNSKLVYSVLVNYIDESIDVDVAKKAVLYLLAQLNAREQRENLLEQILGTVGGKNVALASELTTMLGMLKAEKADVEATEFYLMQAYKKNRYNKPAFAKLMEIKPERIGPAIYLERLRLALRENPSDIDAALAFAQQAEQLQLYDTAAGVYEYCANLFNYLYPSELLPARIYLPWSISSYNSQKNQSKCLQIAQQIQQEGRFDLRLESLAGKVVAKIGNGDVATQIFQDAEKKALRLLRYGSKQTTNISESIQRNDSERISINQVSWFYCFALPIPVKALDWANKANSAEPNSPATRAILAYALMMNNQTEWAKPLLDNLQNNQIAELALAQIQLAEGQRDLAIETLKSAISRDPGSFAAERAKEIMAQQGQQYRAQIDPEAVLNMLEKVFNQTLVPVFTPPENMFSSQLNIRGDEFPFGSEFKGNVEIVNNSAEPLVISDDSLFMGNIRIDADISGDLNRKIPNLFSAKIRTSLFVEPGRNILIPVHLFTGELKNMLLAYPQASLTIDFTLYLDPVISEQGNITNRLTNIQPTRVQIKRPGVKLTGQYLRKQLNLISQENINENIKIARLFISLLREQQEMMDKKLYRFLYADWMEPLLRNALLHENGLLRSSTKEQWIVKVHTMADMLTLPMDYELISAVAMNLNSPNWTVRLMALYLLSTTNDRNFDKVLDWTAKNDSNKHVRDMANALSRSI
jgi:tetratricopeptide (TPR) repeat protein